MLEFIGIDFWNRPVFKSDSDRIYGCLDTLFDYGATKEEVLSVISEEDLCYFGRELDDDPNGGPMPKHLKIRR